MRMILRPEFQTHSQSVTPTAEALTTVAQALVPMAACRGIPNLTSPLSGV